VKRCVGEGPRMPGRRSSNESRLKSSYIPKLRPDLPGGLLRVNISLAGGKSGPRIDDLMLIGGIGGGIRSRPSGG